MYTESYYKELLKSCPDTISKEQLYKLCHISKRAAKYYLDLGVIRCTNNGKATHRYTIRSGARPYRSYHKHHRRDAVLL